ncbi:pleiotropic drug resistance abc transporter, partial [Moniliophthora roreri]
MTFWKPVIRLRTNFIILSISASTLDGGMFSLFFVLFDWPALFCKALKFVGRR